MKRLVLAVALIAGALGLRADEAEIDVLIDRGLSAMYNLDYARSRAAFDELSTRFPRNPIGPYGRATILWWELTNEYDEQNDTLEKQFLAAVDDTVRLTRALAKEDGDPTGVVRLCWGGALGLKGRWDAIGGHWLAAYRAGKQAFNLQSAAIKANPAMYDAYLGPGVFHYMVATLPAAAKVIGRMMFGGSKEQGLQEIRLTMDKGRFASTAARLFLVNLYVNTEKDPATALTLLRAGRAQYPESPFFHYVELLILEEARDWPALEAGAKDYLAKIEAGAPHYLPRFQHMGLFALANAHRGAGRLEDARALYGRVVDRPARDDRWVSLAYLNRGKTFDLLGRREEALADYRTVLKRRDVWQLHDKAKDLVRRPFSAEPPARPRR